MSTVRRFNDYSFIDDNAMEKIANAVNNQEKIIKITDDEKEANLIIHQLNAQGYEAESRYKSGEFFVVARPRFRIPLKKAQASGQFKKIASSHYAFSRAANNPLGIQHYDFDEGTIWKVVSGKDGKEYLVKELD